MASRDSRSRRGNDRRASSNIERTYSHREGGSSHSRSSSYRREGRERYSDGSSYSRDRYSRQSSAYSSSTSLQAPRSSYAQSYVPATGKAAQYSRANTENYSYKRAKKSGRGKRVLAVVLISLFVVLAGAGTAAALFINDINNNLKGGKTQEEQLAIKEQLVATKNFNDPFWMLLIGSDERAGDSEMGQRADTTILVRVDPTTQYVCMMSIPRDTKITYKGSVMKFNAAFAYDDVAGSISAASTLCGVDIAHYAEVNFDSLWDLVDAIGGVDVYVETRIDNEKAGDVAIEAGEQHLDGEAALVYARDRDYADGDFTRTMHQRTLVNAMITKVLSLEVTALPGVVQAVSKCVSTDLTANDVYSLAMQFKDMENLKLYSIMMPSTTGMIGDTSYVLADEAGLKKVIQAMEQSIDPNTITEGITGTTTGTSQTYVTY